MVLLVVVLALVLRFILVFTIKRVTKGLIAQQVSHLKAQLAGLAGAQQLSRPAQLQVFFRNHKAIAAVAQNTQPGYALRGQWAFVHQHTVAGGGTAPDPAAQLVQL